MSDTTQDQAWPFKPGDVVRDSGEGDDAAWLECAPIWTVVQNAEGCEWTRAVRGWFGAHPSWTTSADLVEHGPLTVVSVPEPTTTLHACTVDETAGGAEKTSAVERAAAEVRDEIPTCGLCSDDRCTPCMDDAERYARAALVAALDAVDWPDTLAGHMTITLTDMHRCACHAPLAPSADRYMAEMAHLTHLSAIIRAAILGNDQ